MQTLQEEHQQNEKEREAEKLTYFKDLEVHFTFKLLKLSRLE